MIPSRFRGMRETLEAQCCRGLPDVFVAVALGRAN
jgi:hypothetical protein